MLILLICILFVGKTYAVIHIRGAGASFPHTVYKEWMLLYKAYRKSHVDLNMTYNARGSSFGQRSIKGEEKVEVDYAGSDALLSSEDYAQFPDLVMFPTMAGAVVLGYNLPGLKDNLVLSRQQLVGIYNGTIQTWNDSSILETNPNITLPSEKIKVLVRSDGSGTTEIFTTALSAFDKNWASQFGIFKKYKSTTGQNWNETVVHLSGRTSRGMSGLILSLPFSIGYLSSAEAANAEIPYAKLVNREGTVTEATTEAIQAAMDSKANENPDKLTTSLSNAKGTLSYPIAGYTYIIVPKTKSKYCTTTVELVRYFEWFLFGDEAPTSCKEQKMAPVSEKVAEQIKVNILMKMECDSANMWSVVSSQKYQEYLQDQKWRIPLYVLSSVLAIGIIVLIVFLIYRRIKTNKILAKDQWNIDIEEIEFFSTEKTDTGKTQFVPLEHDKVSITTQSDVEAEAYQLVDHILQWPGKWKNYTIGLRLLEIKHLSKVRNKLKKVLLKMIQDISHPNITKFHGLLLVDNLRHVVSEYCSKGTISEFLRTDRFKLNNDVKLSLTMDIAQGLDYLKTVGIVHGNLNSNCCLIDFHWTVKISDWEYSKIYSSLYVNHQNNLREKQENLSTQEIAFQQFWIAPELLKPNTTANKPTFHSDIYSFSIIVQEIFTRSDPYQEHKETHTYEDLVKAIIYNNLRPKLDIHTPTDVAEMLEGSWKEVPNQRHPIEHWIKTLGNINNFRRRGMLDSMMEAMEKYANSLEKQLQIAQVKQKSGTTLDLLEQKPTSKSL